MGNTLKEVKSNDELVDFLVFADFIKSQKIQLVFRAVDRKLYLPQPHKDIHKDIAVKIKHFHLSAPSVYATVLENLDLKPGLSFLNIGSGTGYLSTMVGLLLGCSGVNHGIELYPDIVEFAEKRVKSFMDASYATDFSNFSKPLFTVGNVFNLMNPEQKYDRVYCGGSCPDKYLSLLYQLVKDDGVLIRATEDSLLKLTRCIKHSWNSRALMGVCFSDLVTPDFETPIRLNDVQPSRLQNICRSYIRSRLKDSIKRKQFILKKKIKGVLPEHFSPNNEPLFDHDEGEYLRNYAIPRDMDVLMTSFLQRFVAREIQRKRINEDHAETQCLSECADNSKQTLKTNPHSSSSVPEENYSSQNLNSSMKNFLTHPDQKVKTIKDSPTAKSNQVSSTFRKENNNSNRNLLRVNGEIKGRCYQNFIHESSQKNNSKQFSKDYKKQQDSEPMTGISAENCEKESRVNIGSSNSILWYELPDFEDIFQKSSPLVEVSFSELMNQKIQDLPLTQSLKDFLM